MKMLYFCDLTTDIFCTETKSHSPRKSQVLPFQRVHNKMKSALDTPIFLSVVFLSRFLGSYINTSPSLSMRRQTFLQLKRP